MKLYRLLTYEKNKKIVQRLPLVISKLTFPNFELTIRLYLLASCRIRKQIWEKKARNKLRLTSQSIENKNCLLLTDFFSYQF